MSAGKAELRAAVRRARRARPAAVRAEQALALARVVLAAPQLDAARVVALYVSTPAEPGTGPLRAALAARGVAVLLPVVVPGGPLAWVRDVAPAGTSARTPDRTRRPRADPVGTGTPRAAEAAARADHPHPADLADADLVLLPALAVDAAGSRLGQGGGHYDRSLAALGRRTLPPLVALVHDEELLPGAVIPAEEHDVPVDAAATPSRWVALGSPPPAGAHRP